MPGLDEEVKARSKRAKVHVFFWRFVVFTSVVGLVPFIWSSYVWNRVGDFETTGRLLQRWNLSSKQILILDSTIQWLNNQKHSDLPSPPNLQKIEQNLGKKMTQTDEMYEHLQVRMNTIEEFYSRVSSAAKGPISEGDAIVVALKSLKTSQEEDLEHKLSEAVRRIKELETELDLMELKFRQFELTTSKIQSVLGQIDPESVVKEATKKIHKVADESLRWLIEKVESEKEHSSVFFFLRRPLQWIISVVTNIF